MSDKIRQCIIPQTYTFCEGRGEKAYTRCNGGKSDEFEIKGCPFKKQCDAFWIRHIWEDLDKACHGVSPLSQPITPIIMGNIRKGLFITCGNDHDNFCMFAAPQSKGMGRVTISDIYVLDSARGKGYSTKLLEYLMETYKGSDLFAKCVRDSSAEAFWKHMVEKYPGSEQEDASGGDGPDFYEHKPNRRDIGWYVIKNPYQTSEKNQLW